jgi:hypothetical protein
MNRTFFLDKLLLVAFLTCGLAVPAHARNDDLESIVALVGPLEPRLADLLGKRVTLAIAVAYHERFSKSDQLDDEEWSGNVDQLVDLSISARGSVLRSIQGSEAELRNSLAAELQKLAPEKIADISRFMKSSEGESWRAANTATEERLFAASARGMIYSIATRARANAVYETVARRREATIAPIFMTEVLQRVVQNPPTTMIVFASPRVLTALDPQLGTAISSASQALTAAVKNGQSTVAYLALVDSLVVVLTRAAASKPQVFTTEPMADVVATARQVADRSIASLKAARRIP